VQKLCQKSEEFRNLAEKIQIFQGEETGLQVISILKVENKFRNLLFQIRAEEDKRISPNKEIQYLFHGSEITNLENILSQGLDPRLSNKKGRFGEGVYCTPFIGKALSYSKQDNVNGTKIVLGVRVTLGRKKIIPKGKIYPGLRREPEGYDSVEGNIDFTENVVYDSIRTTVKHVYVIRETYKDLFDFL
tara:strand:+ start:523 stop:1089 length:567 start_codon:yes stop_codon:yes gene_type:complete